MRKWITGAILILLGAWWVTSSRAPTFPTELKGFEANTIYLGSTGALSTTKPTPYAVTYDFYIVSAPGEQVLKGAAMKESRGNA